MNVFCANCEHRVELDTHGRCEECGSSAVAEFAHETIWPCKEEVDRAVQSIEEKA